MVAKARLIFQVFALRAVNNLDRNL